MCICSLFQTGTKCCDIAPERCMQSLCEMSNKKARAVAVAVAVVKPEQMRIFTNHDCKIIVSYEP